MNICHIVRGEENASNIRIWLNTTEDDSRVLVLRDTLYLGPLDNLEQTGLKDVRSSFWQTTLRKQIDYEDLDRVLELHRLLNEQDNLQLVLWLSPNINDIISYYWILHFLGKFYNRIQVINITGLPFIDDNNTLFFPNNFQELPVKEINKCMRLRRSLTTSEFETDREEWKRLKTENSGWRILEGGKKIVSKAGNSIDYVILQHVQQYKTFKRIVSMLLKEYKGTIDENFIKWRLAILENTGKINIEKQDIYCL